MALWNVDSDAKRLIPGESPAFGDLLAWASDSEVLAIVDGNAIELWNSRTLAREGRYEVSSGALTGLALARNAHVLRPLASMACSPSGVGPRRPTLLPSRRTRALPSAWRSVRTAKLWPLVAPTE